MGFYSDLVVLPEAVEEIKAIGTASIPHEACGVLLPDGKVIQVPNLSEHPEDSYSLSVTDITEAIEEWLNDLPQNVEQIDFFVWHTHPSGSVGPSKGDLEERVVGVKYLVVTLPNGEAVQY